MCKEGLAEQALRRLMALCARAEKSSGDARRLMTKWGVESSVQQGVLEQLQRERFIDDDRYASLFIREKSRLNGWGVYKIRAELHRKGVAREIIEERLAELDTERQRERLAELVARRARTVKYNSIPHLRDKLIRYGASLGYDFSTVNDCVRATLAEQMAEYEEDF